MAEDSHSTNNGDKPEVRPFRFKSDSSSKDGQKRRKRRDKDGTRTRQSTDGVHKRSRDRAHHDAPPTSAYANPDVAFQESLFDAMADDEGAAFWESVYGQPIHVYPNQKLGPDGELERMTDEEYATYVRSKMFEKSHQHLLEEKRRHEEAARRRKSEQAKREEEQHYHAEFERDIDESLQRSRERRRKRHAEQAWKNYQTKWETVLSGNTGVQRTIPWPTHEGERDDVSEEELSRFFRTAALLNTTADADEALLQILKAERVRWHPDKMQQRLGPIEEADMAAVTAVFQIVDKLWGEIRTRGSVK